jgi:Na+:H+ antiporter
MLIDPKAFTERRVLGIAALSLAIVFVGKLAAALISGRLLGLARPQVRLLFGLSLAQAAATLAAVTIGVDLGLFDTPLLNATLVVVLVTVLVSSIVTRSAARRIEPPAVQGERLAETIFVPVDVVDDAAVVEIAARLAMAKGGNVLVGAVAGAAGDQLESARERARSAERQVAGIGAEVSSVVRVDDSEASAFAAIIAEHGVSLMVTGWRRAAVAADVILGGQDVDLVALADVPVLAIMSARGEFRRVVLALDGADLTNLAERDLALAVASVAASATRGKATVLLPDDEEGAAFAAILGERGDVVRDSRSRREALAAIARDDDFVLIPARPGRSPLHRDAAAVAALPVACTVAVPTRARAGAGLVTGTTTFVGSRRTA